MFNGFHKVGTNTMTVRPKNMFAGFPENSSFGQVGGIGGVVSDSLIAWFNPSVNITLNGNTVSQWQDTTGAFSLSQGTAANQPTYKPSQTLYNGRPYLNFSGSPQFMQNNAINLGVGSNPAYTIVLIFAGINWITAGVALSYANTQGANINGGYDLGHMYNSTTYSPYYYQDGTAWGSGSLVGSIYTSGQINMECLEINRGASTIYLSTNSFYHSSSAALTNSITNLNGLPLALGAPVNAGNYYFNANILDILFYNKQLSQTEYLSIYSYFKGLYGLP